MTSRAIPRLLFYNWVPSFDPEKRGGGVAVYQNNCITAFKNRGWTVHSLASGLGYDGLGGEPYVQGRENTFELINSPVTSPTESSFFTDQIAADEPRVTRALVRFIAENGPYDVIHFNNLEGIPAAVIPALRRHFPRVRFVFSLHNYYPMCPQVYLWKNNAKNCDGKDDGKACVSCVGPSRASDTVSHEAISDALFGRPRTKRSFPRKAIRKALRIAKTRKLLTAIRRSFGKPLVFEANPPETASYFATRERKMTEIINESFDVILCVSARVRALALSAGLPPEKCKTSYIGTDFYKGHLPIRSPSEGPILRLAFLGYANRLKGFDFLLSALEQCPEALLAKLHLLVAARGIEPQAQNRLAALAKKMGGLNTRKGYSHTELPNLLNGADLGIVPVVWEDCLPQIAIEFACNGVPVLASNLGGAREIASNPEFEFQAGDVVSFLERIAHFTEDKQNLLKFWRKPLILRSMQAHMDELAQHYGLAQAGSDSVMESQPAAG